MDMSPFRFSCPAARAYHIGDGAGEGAAACICTCVYICACICGAVCVGPRRQCGQHRGRELPLLVQEAVAIPPDAAVQILIPPLAAFHLLPAPPALPYRCPHPRHTPTVFPRFPTRPPQRLHRRVAQREAAHAVREVVLEPSVDYMHVVTQHSVHDSDLRASIYKANCL
ncbi:hypothetical protein JB92DRAFT_3029995 [Gautieria morchelliformis]|nr:hypothetical protein JB92DRAFT_3029995 [Gautieria morchelliformis]